MPGVIGSVTGQRSQFKSLQDNAVGASPKSPADLAAVRIAFFRPSASLNARAPSSSTMHGPSEDLASIIMKEFAMGGKYIAIVGAALALALTAESQAQAPAQGDSVQRQRGEARRGRPDGDRRGMRQQRMKQAGQRGLFRGIELTQAQRDQMKGVNDRYRPQFQALRESMKPHAQAAREARQRGDTAAARAAWERTSDAREKSRALMEQQRSEIRALLTGEQREKFDSNVSSLKEKRSKRGSRG